MKRVLIRTNPFYLKIICASPYGTLLAFVMCPLQMSLNISHGMQWSGGRQLWVLKGCLSKYGIAHVFQIAGYASLAKEHSSGFLLVVLHRGSVPPAWKEPQCALDARCTLHCTTEGNRHPARKLQEAVILLFFSPFFQKSCQVVARRPLPAHLWGSE